MTTIDIELKLSGIGTTAVTLEVTLEATTAATSQPTTTTDETA